MIKKMRVYHRYLGFFLSGVMAVYAISGVIMVFRNTDFLKVEKLIERNVSPGLNAAELGSALKMKRFKAIEETTNNIVFSEGTYDKETGQAKYSLRELPLVLKKFEQMHKATSDRPLYYLNVFFGVSLLFFVISSFLMYAPKTRIFKQGLYVALAGLILTLIMVYI